jgi:hydrogenase expression/formation protein HypC
MCLAIPAQVKSIGEHRMSEVDIMGVSRTVSLDLVPDADVGDYVLVHAGYAIQVVDEEFAKETLELLESLDLTEEEAPPADSPVHAPAEEPSSKA